MKIRAILFDAMETVVEIAPLPSLDDRARWTYERCEEARATWRSLDDFCRSFREARSRFDDRVRTYREFSSAELARAVAASRLNHLPAEEVGTLASCIDRSYEAGYYSHCFVSPDTRAALLRAQKALPIGIVSNQIIHGGLQRFLIAEGLHGFFSSVVTSVDCGWRKPAPQIYSIARQKIGFPFEDIALIGDDYQVDYLKPRELGMYAVLVDRHSNPRTDGVLTAGSIVEAVDHALRFA